MLTWVAVNSQAINYNIRQLKKIIGPQVCFMPVIKSNAYGHGFLEVARICEENTAVDRLCVFSLDEALILIQHKISKPIIILAHYDWDESKLITAIKHSVAFPLFTVEQAKKLNRVGERLGKKAIAHFKIDIGTSRIGILPNELTLFLKSIRRLHYLNYEGIFGHFASSEENSRRTQEQNILFQQAEKILAQHNIFPLLQHAACSAAAILHQPTHYNAVRIGLALYGLDPSLAARKRISLQPALTWHTTVMDVRSVPANSSVSYGRTYLTNGQTKLAVVPVGYWDGYDRGFSNSAFVIIRGQRCPVRGRVCMNMTMIDVTAVPLVKVGDEVLLIGQTKKVSVTADELAEIAQTINYEIVTRINPLLPRIITEKPV